LVIPWFTKKRGMRDKLERIMKIGTEEQNICEKKKKTLACVVCIDVARGKHKNNYFGVREARTLDLRITRKL